MFLSHLSRPQGSYCAVCGAMLLEVEPTCCDECGVAFSFKIECCPGFIMFFLQDALSDNDLSCLDCGQAIDLRDVVFLSI